MNELLNNLTSDEDVFVPLVFLGTGLIITVVAIVFTSVRKMVVSSHVEKSRREIAAYIAEGSMTPEDGERLLNAGPSRKS
jgi:hypothetical protein